MARMTTQEFMNDRGSGRGGGFVKLSEIKKDIGCVHPAGGINSRKRHGSFAYDETDDKDKKKMEYANFNCGNDGCPICLLRDWAARTIEDNPNLAGETVLSGGTGRKALSFTLDELAGNVEGRDGWRQDITAIKPGVVVAWVSINRFDADKPVSILDGSQGMKIKLQDLLDEQMDDNGEKGDPIDHPYPIGVTYKEDEVPAKKYNVYRATGEKAEIPDEVREVLETPLSEYKVNVDKVTAPGDHQEMMRDLTKAWVSDDVSFDDFAKFVAKRRKAREDREGQGGGEPVERRGSGRGRKPNDGGDGEVAGTVECPGCGNVINKGVKFCGGCGAAQDAVGEDVEKCPHCGASVDAGSKFCLTCGKPLDEKSGDGGREEEACVSGDAPEGSVCCPECGEVVKVNKRGRCPECAVLLDGPGPPPPIDTEDIPF